MFRSSEEIKEMVLLAIEQSTSTAQAINQITKILNDTENVSFTALELFTLWR